MAETLNNNFMTREEYRNKKQLDEARKAGNVPAEVDEEGKDINPHMPQYIMQAPWYSGYNHATLKHQRHDEVKMVPISEWYARGAKTHQATKYRKGACTNCGAMTHTSKDCFARPRKYGAKYTNQDIEADELVQDLKLDYDAKRDRWNGYDLNQYQSTIKEHEMYSEEIRKRKRQEIDKTEQMEEDLKQEYGEQEEMGVVTQRDPKVKTMVRNLRQREDTAKYLMNLDVNSAYYDPISRSMRENPLPDGNITNKVVNFKGDNWYRYTGDAAKMIEQEQFVWEQLESKGHDLNINTVGVPTATFIGYKDERNQQFQKSHQVNKQLLQTYGGEEHLKDQWQAVGVGGQSENYLEWTRDGKIKRVGQFKSRGKSRYPEDCFEKGHCAVWGSWWNEILGWGYACCWGTVRGEECIGDRGKKIAVLKEQKIRKQRQQEEINIYGDEVQQQQLPQIEQQQQQQQQQQIELQQQQQQPQIEQQQQQQPQIEQQKQQTENEKAQQQKQQQQQELVINEERKAKEKEGENEREQKQVDDQKQSQNLILQNEKKNISNNHSRSVSSSSSSSSSESDSSISSSSSDSSSSSNSSSSSSLLSSSSSSRSRSRNRQTKHKKSPPKTKKKYCKSKRHNYGLNEKDFANKKLDKEKLKKAIERQRNEQMLNQFNDEKNRKYNSVKGTNDAVTLEDIEAYRLTQRRFEDPMNNNNSKF